MSTSILPAGTMSIVSLKSDVSINERLIGAPLLKAYDSLRSHRFEDSSSKGSSESQAREPDAPKSSTITNANYPTRWRSCNDTGTDDHPLQQTIIFPEQCSLQYSGSKKGFGNSASSSPSHADFPVVPTRPPLRPTVSFGGVSVISSYSTASDELEKKSLALADEEASLRSHFSRITIPGRRLYRRLARRMDRLGKRSSKTAALGDKDLQSPSTV